MDKTGKQTLREHISRRQVLKYGIYGGLTASASNMLWLTGCGKKAKSKGPSIILITVDTLRPDYLGCYGCTEDTSGNIDRFAEDALLFENCLSHAPETRLSFASMLSGFLPYETKIAEKNWFPKEVKTLAEILKRQGYKTAAVVSNFVLRKGLGWEQGFAIYDDTMNENELVRNLPERIAEYTTNRAIELLRQFHKKPLFLCVHYQDPHGPYTPPEPYNKMFQNPRQLPHYIRLSRSMSGYGGIPSYQKLQTHRDYHHYVSQYKGEIRYQDEHFKRLIDALKQLGLYDSAFIVFSSDHGEGMGEHNYYFAHGENLYNNQIHVPLIIKLGTQLAGRRTDLVGHIDIVPTILNIAGIEPDQHLRGGDLRKEPETKREIFAEMNSPLLLERIKYAIVLDELKLIHAPRYKQYELYNIKVDPHEENNLISNSQYVQQTDDLKTRLKRICEEDFLKLPSDIKRREFTNEEIEKLKSLGYLR